MTLSVGNAESFIIVIGLCSVLFFYENEQRGQ